jgi:hypothetical protein
MWSVVAVVALVVLIATYVTWIASRLDRLHARAGATQAALDAHLVRRAVAAAELAEVLGRPELRQAARAALEAVEDERESTENDLTRELRRAPLVEGVPAAAAAVETSRRVALTRQVHNDSVRDALAIRRRPLVRLLRLHHRHAAPAYFDVDDPLLDPAVAAS